MRDINEKDETWHHMEVPQEIGIDSYVFKEEGQKVTAKRNPVICACGGEVSHVDMCLNDLMVRDSVALHKKTREFQEEDEEQGGDVLFFRPELIGPNHKTTDNRHYATHQDEKTEELKKEIEKRADWPCLEFMRKRKGGELFAQFYQVTGRKPLDHIYNKGSYESEYQKGMSEPSIK